MSKIIIHCWNGIDHQEALGKVLAVVEQGKISGDGKSYCYVTKWGDRIVATREPRKGTKTYTFYVYRDNQPPNSRSRKDG